LRIAYLFEPTKEVGSSNQAITLSRNWDELIPLSSSPIQGDPKEGTAEVNTNAFGKLRYPIKSPLIGLETLDPDICFIHTLSDPILSHIQEISSRWPTALRLGINPMEWWVSSGWHNKIPKLLTLLDWVDCVICPSKLIKSNLEAMGLKNCVHIPSCVDLGEWELADPEGNLVVSIGRISQIKNHLYATFAMRIVWHWVPGVIYKVYGTGRMLKSLRNVIEVQGSQPWMSLEGFKDAREVLPKAKVFLQTSISENMSLSVLESCASGVPVVATKIEGHTVGQVSHESIKEMAEEVERHLTDREYWEERRDECLEKAKEYDVGRILPLYKELFEALTRLDEFKEESRRLEVSA